MTIPTIALVATAWGIILAATIFSLIWLYDKIQERRKAEEAK
jgi:hypothetical protein